jgi:hypothetical protein
MPRRRRASRRRWASSRRRGRPAILGIEGLEARADEHVPIRSRGVRPPGELAGPGVERGEPPADAEFPAAVAHQDLALHHQRSHGDALALVDVSQLRVPDFLPGLGVHGDRVPVERVEVDPALPVRGAPVHHVAAGDALRCASGRGRELPLERRPIAREVERVERVGERGDDVHGPADHERSRLVSPDDARREGEGELEPGNVGDVDLVEPAVAGGGVVLGGDGPLGLARIGLQGGLQGGGPSPAGSGSAAGARKRQLGIALVVRAPGRGAGRSGAGGQRRESENRERRLTHAPAPSAAMVLSPIHPPPHLLLRPRPPG